MLWVFANQVISYAHACKCIDQQTHRETDTVTHTDMDIDTDLQRHNTHTCTHTHTFVTGFVILSYNNICTLLKAQDFSQSNL